MTFEQKISVISGQLKKPLPGKQQQYLMAPAFRGEPNINSPGKNAAIMICLYPVEKDITTVFIKRNAYDGPHSGQVSFPGGVFEENDIFLVETARRETKEEIGIDIGKSSILGALTPLTIPVSNMNVHPYVGFYGSVPEFTPDNREVEYVITTSLSELADPKCIKREQWILHGQEIEVPFYNVKGNIIWGATAMILCEFLAVISSSGLYQQFRY